MKKVVKPGEIFAILLAFISIAPFCYVLILSFIPSGGGRRFFIWRRTCCPFRTFGEFAGRRRACWRFP